MPSDLSEGTHHLPRRREKLRESSQAFRIVPNHHETAALHETGLLDIVKCPGPLAGWISRRPAHASRARDSSMASWSPSNILHAMRGFSSGGLLMVLLSLLLDGLFTKDFARGHEPDEGGQPLRIVQDGRMQRGTKSLTYRHASCPIHAYTPLGRWSCGGDSPYPRGWRRVELAGNATVPGRRVLGKWPFNK